MKKAAAQGLAAGLNAAASALDLAEIRFDRRSSYIGVMIDDLTLQGVSEPYRMMTARAEYRLSLRADNATTRLGEAALSAGAFRGGGASRSSAISAGELRLAGQRPPRARPTRSTRPMSSARRANGKSSSATRACGSPASSNMRQSRAFPMRWSSA